jgi:hypothetical protein
MCFNALLPMRILKHTMLATTPNADMWCHSMLQYNLIFHTTRGASSQVPPVRPMFKVQGQVLVTCSSHYFSYSTKQKTPGFLVLGSLEVEYAILLYSVSLDPVPAIIIHLNRKPQGGAGALTWCEWFNG